MDILIYNLLRYLLLFSFITAGYKFYNNNEANYWRTLTYPIVLYSIMEGCRWMRGTDFYGNFQIANGRAYSNDILYDGFAAIIHNLDLPYYFFFIAISFLLIYSILLFLKDYKEAFLPCILLIYAFTMNQSENLMRQYAAISLMLISVYFLLREKYLHCVVILILSYFIHSSVLFVIPFLLIFKILSIKKMQYSFIVKNICWIFLLCYLSSTIISTFFSDLLYNLHVFDIGLSVKYNDEEYLSRATATVTNINSMNEMSTIDTIRTQIRNVVIIMLGGYLLKNTSYESSNKQALFITYCLGCSGIIYMTSLPKLNMEVIARLGLYLQIFEYFFEGCIIYYFYKNRNNINRWINYILIVLIVLEFIWIFKPSVGSDLGLQFIWG
jgi:hypothetical protein